MIAPPARHFSRFSLLALLSAAACEPSGAPQGPNDASASPNASILPAPLATEAPDLDGGGAVDDGGGARVIAAESSARPVAIDAGAVPSPPPESMRPATPLPVEGVPFQTNVSGVSLDAVFRWRDVPSAPRAPEVSADGLREAQKLTALTMKIDVTDAGRMRAELLGRAFPLPAHTEIRARVDHYGSIVVWPNATEYRVVPPGALRALIGERRVDVAPLSGGSARAQGEGRRLGVVVRKVELGSSVATVKIELGKVNEAGEGGLVLCRALVEMGGVDPKTSVCQTGEVPLFASYAWQEGGGIVFEVTAMQRRTDLPANAMLVPAPSVRLAPAGLPVVPQGIFLSREELAAFRLSPLPLPPVRDANVPGEGFVAANHADRLMYLLLDGVPVVAVPPNSERYVIGPPKGRYHAQWRSFLGEKILPPKTIEMPTRVVHGSPADAGAPDGG